MKKLLILLIIPFLSFAQDNCEIDLGEDIITCDENIVLDAGEGYDSYLWSTGESSQTITVNESGTYSIETWNGNNNNYSSGSSNIDENLVELLNNGTCIESLLNNGVSVDDFIGLNIGGGALSPLVIFHIDEETNLAYITHGNLSEWWCSQFCGFSPSGLNQYAVWGCQGTLINGADGFEIGEGQQNTIDIANMCNDEEQFSNDGGELFQVAAPTINSVEFNEINNWFLPSYNELLQLRINLPGFLSNQFWTSTEHNADSAYCINPNLTVEELMENIENDNIEIQPKNNNLFISPITTINIECETTCESIDEINITINVCGCMDETACNYDSEANEDDGGCEYILDGECDCEGNVMDCSEICGGNSILDDCGVCEGDNSSCSGCTDEIACNYDPLAEVDDGSCITCASSEFLNGEYLDTDGILFSNANGVTISLWVYDDDFFQNPTLQQPFATYIDFGSQDNYRYVIRNRSGKIEAFFEGDALPTTLNGVSVNWDYPFTSSAGGLSEGYCGTTSDGWHNVTAVYCATGVRVYIDGVIASAGVTGVFFDEFLLVSEDIKRIGNNQSLDEPADALIDEVRIWSRALSVEEVFDRAGTASQINLNIDEEINLVGYWKLDCSYTNEVTNLEATNYASTFSSQHCGYSECGEMEYEYPCNQLDCNSCDPPEGCMDELACNYDPLAIIDISSNCFYVEDYCPDVEYPQYYDCECKCLNDMDNDTVCDELDCSPEVFNPDQDCTNIEEQHVERKYILITDVLGREVNVDNKGILLLQKFDDGSVEKKYIVK